MRQLQTGFSHIAYIPDVIIDEQRTVPQISSALSAFAENPPVFAAGL